MITTYNTYIKESNEIDNVYKIIKKTLQEYSNKYLNILYQDHWYNTSYYYSFYLYFNGNDIINIDYLYKKKVINIIIYDENIIITEIEDIEDKINNCLDNIYNSIYYSLKNNEYLLSIQDIPVLNIDKYCDFLEELFNDNEKYFDYYVTNFQVFIDFIYNNEEFDYIKDNLDKRFKHLIEAKNFDLI